MTRIKLIGVIVIVIVMVCIFFIIYIYHTADNISTLLSQLTVEMQDGEYHQALKRVEEIEQLWEKNAAILLLFVHHREINTVQHDIIALKVNIYFQEKENVSSGITLIEKIQLELKKLYEDELPLLKNIF